MMDFLVAHVQATNDVILPTLSATLAGTNANQNAMNFLNRIADLLLALAIPLAIIGVVYAAFALIKAAGKPDGYANAKKNLLAVGTGIILIVFAAIIVRFLYNLFI